MIQNNSTDGICTCTVPNRLHGTACGWRNAHYIMQPVNEQERHWQKQWEKANPTIKFLNHTTMNGLTVEDQEFLSNYPDQAKQFFEDRKQEVYNSPDAKAKWDRIKNELKPFEARIEQSVATARESLINHGIKTEILERLISIGFDIGQEAAISGPTAQKQNSSAKQNENTQTN